MNRDEEKNRSKVVIGPEKYKVLTSGIYRARLVNVDDSLGAYKQPVFKLCFDIQEGDFANCRINAIVNRSSYGKRGKLWQLYRALMRAELDVLDSFYVDDLIGMECFVNVEQRGKNNNAITEFIPLDDLKNIERSGL